MRSILLLLSLISLISRIKSEESKDSKSDTNEVKYVGPIVYSNEKPPIIVFPNPPNSPTKDEKTVQKNITLNDKNIEYVPFPYQELPVLIYKSKDIPPIHMVSQNSFTDGSNHLNNSLTNIDKRLGETANTSNQRGSRALKWSNFKLFNDKPVIMKTQKWGSTHMIDSNKSSILSQINSPLALSSAPHVVYSGHPPIHVFPQPIIIKEPEMSEFASASEPFHALKSPNSGNSFDISSMSQSNKPEVSSNPASTQFYSYSGTPLGSGSTKSYGFRVKTRGNKQDTDFSGSTNYDNYDETYSPQHSDGSSESSSDENSKYKPSSQFLNSISSSDSEKDYDKDFDKVFERPIDLYSKEKSREKYPKFNSNQWLDWDSDNSWLTSLFGYNRYPSRPRRPLTLSFVNSPSNEHFLFAGNPGNQLEMENLALMNPHMRPHNGWVTGINPIRPTASAIRPVYSFNNFFNYRRPPMAAAPPPPPQQHNPFYSRINPGMGPAATNLAPVALKQIGMVPPIMGLPSMSYPMRIPISPFMMYGLRRPVIGPNGDLTFAESTRNTTNNGSQKQWVNIPDDYQMSGSHFQPTYVLPSAKPISALVQKKPPIIIYQGLRAPVHVYKQPNITVSHNSESIQNSLMSFLKQSQENQESVSGVGEQRLSDEFVTTQSPYYQLYSTEDSNQSFGNDYKSGPAFYINENSAFSPRHSSGEWIPVKQNINSSKDNELKE